MKSFANSCTTSRSMDSIVQAVQWCCQFNFAFVREQSEGATEHTYSRLCANPKCTLAELGHILKWQLSCCVTVMPQQMFLPHVMVRLQGIRRTEHVVFTYISGEDVQALRLVGGGLLAPKNSPKNSCPIFWIPDWPLWLGMGYKWYWTTGEARKAASAILLDREAGQTDRPSGAITFRDLLDLFISSVCSRIGQSRRISILKIPSNNYTLGTNSEGSVSVARYIIMYSKRSIRTWGRRLHV